MAGLIRISSVPFRRMENNFRLDEHKYIRKNLESLFFIPREASEKLSKKFINPNSIPLVNPNIYDLIVIAI